VQAQNTKTRIYVNVLSDKLGRYQIQGLPPGEYEVRANAVGYKSDPRVGVKLGGGESSSLDFAMEKGWFAGATFPCIREENCARRERKATAFRGVFLPATDSRVEWPRRARDADGLGASRQLHAGRPARAPGQSHRRSTRGHDYFLFE